MKVDGLPFPSLSCPWMGLWEAGLPRGLCLRSRVTPGCWHGLRNARWVVSAEFVVYTPPPPHPFPLKIHLVESERIKKGW